ncbi:P-loop NTPase fold protein [Pseudomonas prosekii]|uniref:KAP NTPase domain-containing protein n=1 Tax=Pseudomonas prosekii TaxID=1148509 RepID=A0A2U2DBA2_9PSED|nr:P-loop NTPase fold protein [Pseudomonas prosekii]PWE46676.1 hypothetical protein C9I49_06985 [Pseudomonas prosekii]
MNTAAQIAIKFDPSYGVISDGVGSIVRKPLDKAIEQFLAEPALQTAYDSLTKQLRASDLRFLVTIDDLDRLEKSEVKTVMQMVKTVGQLPNVTYLLAYDRTIISRALDEENSYGPKFSEKIVQLEVELPKPTRGSLLKALDSEIDFLTSSSEDSTRWAYLIRDGIHRWISSPRDVVRLSNAVKLSWPAIKGEIDPLDLLIIEGLRLFEAHAFDWIKKNRDFLFSQGQYLIHSDNLRSAIVSSLNDRLNPETKIQTMRILSLLFPQSGKWFEGMEPHNPEHIADVSRRRGIGCQAGYDTFFGLYPSKDEISKATIESICSDLDNFEFIAQTLNSFVGKTNSQDELMIIKFLDELRYRYQGIEPARPTQAMLEALFDIGDTILMTDEDHGLFTLSGRAQLSFIITNILKLWGKDSAGEHLIKAFLKIGSPAICSDIYVSRGREFGTFRSGNVDPPIISKPDFEKLGEVLLDIIQDQEASNKLLDAPVYYDILRSWEHLDDWHAPKLWLETKVYLCFEHFIKAAKGLVIYSIGTKTRSYSMQSKPDPNLYDLSKLVKACNLHLSSATMSSEEKSLVEAVHEGCINFQKEKKNSG